MSLLLKLILPAAVVAFSFQSVCAQTATGGGGYKPAPSPCISGIQKVETEKRIQENRKVLLLAGKLKTPKKTRVSLSWPLKQAAGFDYCSYYGISNFVDHDLNYPNLVEDFNCGQRTYDLASGYNHGGADIFLWPFDWNMYADGQVEVIAAAPGTIVDKYDGNTDMNCDFSNPNWNAVFVEHSDGTVAWYGHMKNGSLTTKPIGGTVVTGEKLGLVASSGSSTGPHLHFELHDVANNLVDPFSGPCNPGAANLWSPARDYYDPAVNVTLTHDAPPVFNTCPALHTKNTRDTFFASELVYFASYFRDQLTNLQATYTVRRPDNSVFQTWNHTPNIYYEASYWYWSYNIPASPQYGTWHFDVTMNGITCSHAFYVIDPNATAVNNVDIPKPQLLVTPNPSKDQVWISGTNENIELYDLQGRMIGILFAAKMNDISGLTPGVYLLKSGEKRGKMEVVE